jgi:hypothetical protein
MSNPNNVRVIDVKNLDAAPTPVQVISGEKADEILANLQEEARRAETSRYGANVLIGGQVAMTQEWNELNDGHAVPPEVIEKLNEDK